MHTFILTCFYILYTQTCLLRELKVAATAKASWLCIMALHQVDNVFTQSVCELDVPQYHSSELHGERLLQ